MIKNASVDANGVETAAITKEYDKLGRLTKYTDAAGGWTRTTYDRLGQPLTVTDSIGTTRTYTYDRSVEARGFVTQMVDSVAGTITPIWGPDGQLESQLLPGGVRLTLTYDTARVPTARTYTRVSDGVVIARDSVVENHRGQWITHASDTGVRNYRYDRLGRLTGVDDTSAATDQCTSRTYGYDTHTNRTSFTQATGAVADVCPGTTGATTVTSSYDTADRLVSSSAAGGSSWSYDKLGRVTGMPVAGGSVVAANEYFVNDLVAAQEVPGDTRSVWTLDPLQRFATEDTSVWVDGAWANSTEQVSHFDGDGDEPAWIVEDATVPDVVSRFVEGMDGAVAVATTGTGGRVLQLVDLHGDVTGTLPIGDGEAVASWSGLQFTSFDEFGNPEPLTSAATGNAPPRYGWLGAAQRSADTPSGTVLMGVRLYSPVIGRFLQVDPVPGGSASAYDYCDADPVNCTDLGGTFSWKGLVKAVAVVADVASIIPGPVGACAGGLAAGAYLAVGDKEAALWAAAGAAAALVGAGGLVAAARVTRVVKAARAFHTGVVGAEGAVRASRPIAAIAGRIYVGRGAVRGVADNGAKMLSRGVRENAIHYRSAAKKGAFGWSSNIDTGTKGISVRGKSSYNSFHIMHRSRWF
ncbi:RHS repeat-associated core domain-containing protein [Cellulomonas soli]